MHHAPDTSASSDRRTGAPSRRFADPAHGSNGLGEPVAPSGHGRAPVRRRHLYMIRRLLSLVGKPPLAVTLWDGQVIRASDAPPVATIVVHNAQALRRMLLSPYYQFCEAYANGQIDVLGDLVSMITTIDHALRASRAAQFLYNLSSQWLRMPRFNSLSASRDNVYSHYDIGNDFYRLWLDEQLAYTCAYFPELDVSLEQAQVSKFDHVCRKVDLRPGETVVEAGCGWGGLALHMARHYGVTVKAYNVSHEQVVYARQRAKKEGLSDRVEFIEDDWRHIRGRYDAFVSIGMLEHVGKANYRRLGEVIHRVLDANGRGILHTIGRNKPAPVDRWIERRISPAATLPR